MGMLNFRDGLTAWTCFLWSSRTGLDEFEIVGADGRVSLLPLDGPTLTITAAGKTTEEKLPPPANRHEPLIRDFSSALLEKREPVVSGSEGRKTTLIMDAIYRSAESGGVVRVPAGRQIRVIGGGTAMNARKTWLLAVWVGLLCLGAWSCKEGQETTLIAGAERWDSSKPLAIFDVAAGRQEQVEPVAQAEVNLKELCQLWGIDWAVCGGDLSIREMNADGSSGPACTFQAEPFPDDPARVRLVWRVPGKIPLKTVRRFGLFVLPLQGTATLTPFLAPGLKVAESEDKIVIENEYFRIEHPKRRMAGSHSRSPSRHRGAWMLRFASTTGCITRRSGALACVAISSPWSGLLLPARSARPSA